MLTNETKDRYGLFIPDEVVTVLNRKNKLTKSGYVEITTVVLYIIVQEILVNFGFNIESKYDKADYNISQADIDRIARIRKVTGVPVVMHGGSGISDEDFRKCIENGVRKINFYTYAAKYAGEYVKKKLEESSGYVFYHDVAVWGLESMKKTYIDTIKIFANLK